MDEGHTIPEQYAAVIGKIEIKEEDTLADDSSTCDPLMPDPDQKTLFEPLDTWHCEGVAVKEEPVDYDELIGDGEPDVMGICLDQDSMEDNSMLSLEDMVNVQIAETFQTTSTDQGNSARCTRKQRARRPAECQQCGRVLSCSKSLRQHMLTHTGDKPHHCYSCDRRFAHLSTLRKHIARHNATKKPKAAATPTRSTWNQPSECKVCGKVLSRPDALKSHMLTHSGDKLHHCYVCDRKFAQACNLKKHIKKHFDPKTKKVKGLWKTRQGICPLCGKVLSRATNLNRHLRIHSGERPFQCPVCNTRFTEAGSLKKHMLVWCRREHECHICNRRFRNLERHMLAHTGQHWTDIKQEPSESPPPSQFEGLPEDEFTDATLSAGSGEHPYHCPVCSYRCRQLSNFKRHVRRHEQRSTDVATNWSNTAVDECGDVVSADERTGARVMPYRCEECGRCFKGNSGLRTHMLIHADVRPFHCSICDYRCRQKSNLTAHMYRRHLKCEGEDLQTCDI